MPRAIFNDTVIAETDDFAEADGNVYFPPESVNMDYLAETPTTSVCPWKGTANYYTVRVNGEEAADAAWVYRNAKDKAKHLEGKIAFWRGVRVER